MDLADVTSDLAALDSTGSWVVVVTFEGDVTCARFRRVERPPTQDAVLGVPLRGHASPVHAEAARVAVHAAPAIHRSAVRCTTGCDGSSVSASARTGAAYRTLLAKSCGAPSAPRAVVGVTT